MFGGFSGPAVDGIYYYIELIGREVRKLVDLVSTPPRTIWAQTCKFAHQLRTPRGGFGPKHYRNENRIPRNSPRRAERLGVRVGNCGVFRGNVNSDVRPNQTCFCARERRGEK